MDAFGIFIFGSLAVFMLTIAWIMWQDHKDAGVHLDPSTPPVDLSKVYKEPLGFQPHGSRDTFVPRRMHSMSTDDFIYHLGDVINNEAPITLDDLNRDMEHVLAMLVDAREILDDVLMQDLPDELWNRVSNWLVKGRA
jgi:hypothetical protein